MASSQLPFIGIDFGTSKSTMAWYNPKTQQAEGLLNFEGEDKTPSVVYFGKNEILVGTPAKYMLEAENEQYRVISSVKRGLHNSVARVIDGKKIKPVEVASIIMRKLKNDAERLHFKQPIPRAVITHPASFSVSQRDRLKEAALLAGFSEVKLLPEPVAAAMAYGYTGYRVGNYILVFDMGGGTFDVAVLQRAQDASSSVVLPPVGLPDCGGDDLDRELYAYCNEIALQKKGRGISLTNDIYPHFLDRCRQFKERLSLSQQVTLSVPLPSQNDIQFFEEPLSRATFESRITKYIARTVQLTKEMVQDAHERNYAVESVLLIGGSSKVPLVQRMLAQERLAVEEWQQRERAVVLGAAYYAYHTNWNPESTNQTIVQIPKPMPAEEYRKAVTDNCMGQYLTMEILNKLNTVAENLGLSKGTAAAIEREVMGDTKVEIFERQQQYKCREEYRNAVINIWAKQPWTYTNLDELSNLQNKLGLCKEEVGPIEVKIMGKYKEDIPPPPPPRSLEQKPRKKLAFPIDFQSGRLGQSATLRGLDSATNVITPAKKKIWKFTVGKFFLIVLLLFSLFMTLGAFSASAGAGVVLLIISAALFWLVVRKNKELPS